MRTVFVLAMAVCGVLGFGAAASAQENVYPPRTLVIVVDPDTLGRADPFEVSLLGCTDDENIVFTFGEVRLTDICVDRVASQTFLAPNIEGTATGVVSFAGSASDIGFFTIYVLGDLPDGLDLSGLDVAGPDVAALIIELAEQFEVIELRSDPTVLIMSALAVLAGAATIAQLPRS